MATVDRTQLNAVLMQDGSSGANAHYSITEQLGKSIRRHGLTIVDDTGRPLSDAQIKALCERLPDIVSSGRGQGGETALVEAWERQVAGYAGADPSRIISLKSLLLGMQAAPPGILFKGVKDEPVTGKRLDQDVIDAYLEAMKKSDGKRKETKELLESLAAESKIFAYIQALINTAVANKSIFMTGDMGSGGLNNRKLFGYATDEAWKSSPEYKLLSGLDTFVAGPPEYITIGGFLSGRTRDDVPGPRKESSPVAVQEIYSYDKDNNPVAAFSQSVGDRARSVNDKVSQQSVILKDATGRYDTATESLNSFIKKYFDLLNEILRAV
ncbi:virulence-associated V antigen [Pseudomonas entomophila]|uniref:virulence-associated V antigen n=1 Tax=Pseudomonas entomophila TaxID=312306 RepID=UPI002406EF9E|nr:virulence-associated V antigen [Pseudomonas entomophila]MDF9618791.1 virulence-associated V antigen [Pseudomonas entomophila]